MSTRVMEQVDEWESRPFEGGYAELHTLADEGFSGVIRAGPAELYMTKGTVVGVLGGTVEDFEDGTGTVYEAPSPALPLLAVMQDQDEDARAEYYTEDTGLDEVDSKLADGGFTGYVELAENVLSGDYFVVYHQGRSMSVAFVGPESRVKTGDDARERAIDEIGIYRVYPAEIDSVELPEPASTPESESAAASTSEPESEEPETATATAGPVGETAAEAEEASTETETAQPEETSGETETDTEPEEASAETGTETAAGTADATAEASSGAVDRPADDGAAETGPDAASKGQTGGSAQSGSAGSDRANATASQPQKPSTPESGSAHLETRSIPSLDPGRTETDDRGQEEQGRESGDPLGGPAAGAAAQPGTRRRDPDGTAPAHRETGRSAERGQQGGESAGRAEDTRGADLDAGRVEELETQLDDREAEIERLEAELESATEERDRLEAELESATEERDRLEDELAAVREERDDLEEEIERLEAELDRLESEFGAATDREKRISSREALEGTDVFVRYRSKGDATLTDAHDSGILQEDVVENLRLEKHTQFDADAVSVGGQTYGEFLEGRVEYQFVEWVAEELLFEIRDTGHADALRTLYDALPRVDRAELYGTVEVVRTENGEETRSTEQFDVVYRDRMGDPLLVANINDSREAATQSMMEDLVTAAERVGQSSDGLAAAFLVTESFFEPGALETASEATRGGLLSRSKYKSFVNLSRKRGYHLCLVEARSENFTLSVPEL